jgi:hypothetical protein
VVVLDLLASHLEQLAKIDSEPTAKHPHQEYRDVVGVSSPRSRLRAGNLVVVELD